MPSYRLYCLDGGGHIGLADWIEAETDEEAVSQARKLKPHAHKCEVWLDKRLVAKLSTEGRLERVAQP